jgi:hypothetical protein
MLGPIGSNLMLILQVLTPAEIDLYTQKARDRSVRAPMAAGAEELDIAYDHRGPPDGFTENKKGNKESGDPEKNDESSQQAKILPLFKNEISHNDEVDEENSNSDYNLGEAPSNNQVDELENHDLINKKQGSELESIGVYSADTIKKQRQREALKKRQSQPSASMFLIDQRNKLKSSQNKLREQTALKNYQKNAHVESIHRDIDIDAEEVDGEVNNSSGVAGILVNKKQF